MWITFILPSMELNQIKGLGTKRIESLNKAGIKTPIDLLYCFPYDYISEKNKDLSALQDGDIAVIDCCIKDIKVNYISKSLIIASAVAYSDSAQIRLKWFNQRFVKNSFDPDTRYTIYGQLKITQKEKYILNPKKIVIDRPIIPLYKKVSGISGTVIASALKSVLQNYNIKSVLPEKIAEKYGLKNLNDLFADIHLPSDSDAPTRARTNLAIYLLALQIASYRASQPENGSQRKFFYSDNLSKLKEAVNSLSYSLTKQQQDVLDEIVASLHSEKTMNRLVQGDVGCGKTIVALLSMYYAFLSGYQSVLMAPTELLCAQHFNAAIFFERFGVKVCMLSGKQSKAVRQKILFDIKYGSVDFIIATHAVLNEDISFYKLGLVVTDEQQRFGVSQRAALKNKSACDYLTLTATPIPRSLAMVMYGELQQSVISAKPLSRPKVKTSFVNSSKINEMFEYFYKKAEQGEKTYIVCPRIDSDEDELTSCIDLYNKLLKTKLKKYLGLLHGRLDDEEKTMTMSKFLSGEIKIIVATTIIEVGIDVKEATSIAIFDPDRYGLSQLHQLRGRVGRGSLESYCFLITDDKSERLKMFAENDDGFSLAEYDLQTRGAGDFIGLRQHGKTEIFKNVNIDGDIIKKAGIIAENLLSSNEFIFDTGITYNSNYKDIILN